MKPETSFFQVKVQYAFYGGTYWQRAEMQPNYSQDGQMKIWQWGDKCENGFLDFFPVSLFIPHHALDSKIIVIPYHHHPIIRQVVQTYPQLQELYTFLSLSFNIETQSDMQAGVKVHRIYILY